MQIKTIVTVIATALLTIVFVPASSAQDNNGSAQDGIEVITIIGKRPAPTVATACVNEVMAHSAAASGNPHDDGNFSEETQAARRANMINVRHAIRHCIEQAATPAAARI